MTVRLSCTVLDTLRHSCIQSQLICCECVSCDFSAHYSVSSGITLLSNLGTANVDSYTFVVLSLSSALRVSMWCAGGRSDGTCNVNEDE